MGATHVIISSHPQERRRCDIILTYPNPPQGRDFLIVLMYINSPSLGEGRGGSELCRPDRACKLRFLNMVALPHYPRLCRPCRTYVAFILCVSAPMRFDPHSESLSPPFVAYSASLPEWDLNGTCNGLAADLQGSCLNEK